VIGSLGNSNDPQGTNQLKEIAKMEIKRIGSQPSSKGPSEWFTGTVRIDPLFQAPDPALVSGGRVTFEPGARTAWHTHPLGQTLIVTTGCGRAQHWGGPIEEIRPGDVVWFSPGEKHWHGATPTTAMTHIAIQEKKDGKVVDLDGGRHRRAIPQLGLSTQTLASSLRKRQREWRTEPWIPSR